MHHLRLISLCIWISAITLCLASTSCKKESDENAKVEPVKLERGINKSELGPKEAFDQAINDLREGNLGSLWDSLPHSHQQDITDLAQLLGYALNDHLHVQCTSIVRVLSSLLKNQKIFILNYLNTHPPFMDRKILATWTANYDNVATLLEWISNSQLATPEGLKSIDIERLIAKLEPTAKPMVAKFWHDFHSLDIKNLTAELKEHSGGRASLKLSGSKKQAGQITLKRENNRWLPESLFSAWKTDTKNLKSDISQLSKMTFTELTAIPTWLAVIRGKLQKLENTQTQEDFNAQLNQLVKEIEEKL